MEADARERLEIADVTLEHIDEPQGVVQNAVFSMAMSLSVIAEVMLDQKEEWGPMMAVDWAAEEEEDYSDVPDEDDLMGPDDELPDLSETPDEEEEDADDEDDTDEED